MAVYKISPASGKVTGTSSNMPLLLIPSATAIGTITTAEANSIRIYSDVGLTTELAREVVSADEIHFKASSVSSSSEFWVDIDGVRADYAVTDTYGRNAVWSDYEAVYHLNNANDSTVNARTLTEVNSPTYTTGKLGNCVDFSSSAGKNLNRTGDNYGVYHTSSVTVSVWYNATADTGAEAQVWVRATQSGGRYGWQAIQYANPSSVRTQFWNRMNSSAIGVNYNEAHTATTNQWFHSYYTWNSSDNLIRAYRDGAFRGSNSSSGDFTASGQALALGTWWASRTTGTWKGKLDEFRLRGGVLSADWISTEYQNQNDNGTFWDVTVAGTFSPTPMMHQMMMAGGMV